MIQIHFWFHKRFIFRQCFDKFRQFCISFWNFSTHERYGYYVTENKKKRIQIIAKYLEKTAQKYMTCWPLTSIFSDRPDFIYNLLLHARPLRYTVTQYTYTYLASRIFTPRCLLPSKLPQLAWSKCVVWPFDNPWFTY